MYRSRDTFDNAKFDYDPAVTDSEEVLMNLCREEVHFPEETWSAFVKAYAQRVSKKQFQ